MCYSGTMTEYTEDAFWTEPIEGSGRVSDHRVNSFKINAFIFDILPYEFVSH